MNEIYFQDGVILYNNDTTWMYVLMIFTTFLTVWECNSKESISNGISKLFTPLINLIILTITVFLLKFLIFEGVFDLGISFSKDLFALNLLGVLYVVKKGSIET